MWLLCVSRVAGVHVVTVCQPGGWSTCGYCVSAGWLEYMWLLCVSRVAGVARRIFSPCLMEADCSLMIISTQMKAEDPLRNSCYVVICCGVQSSV